MLRATSGLAAFPRGGRSSGLETRSGGGGGPAGGRSSGFESGFVVGDGLSSMPAYHGPADQHQRRNSPLRLYSKSHSASSCSPGMPHEHRHWLIYHPNLGGGGQALSQGRQVEARPIALDGRGESAPGISGDDQEAHRPAQEGHLRRQRGHRQLEAAQAPGRRSHAQEHSGLAVSQLAQGLGGDHRGERCQQEEGNRGQHNPRQQDTGLAKKL